jgi:ABC-type Mn2+/Zn2+ transport system permease subunit
VPSATARLVAGSMRGLLAGGVALALLEGVGGLLLADQLNLPPGPAIAVLGGAIFAVVAVGRSARTASSLASPSQSDGLGRRAEGPA